MIRPIEPADAEALVEFHRGLSLDSTRLRYFSPHPRLSEREVEHFTCVDHHDREALVALDGDVLIGVARFERLDFVTASGTDAGTDAEMAFVVADRWQGHGIATTLLHQLAERAAAEGIDRLVADTLVENHAMIDVFQHAGFPVTRTSDQGVAHFELSLGVLQERSSGSRTANPRPGELSSGR